MRLRAILTLVATLCVARPAVATEYWVDAAAGPGGDGSSDAPFTTLNEAKATIHTGDTVFIRDGTYNETVDFGQIPDGGGMRTTVRAAAGALPVIDGGGTSGFVLRVSETPNVTFQGLTVRNGAIAFEFHRTDGGQVINCTTRATPESVSFSSSNHGYVAFSDLEGRISGDASVGTDIYNNEVFGSPTEGIAMHGARNLQCVGNWVHDNTSANVYLDGMSDSQVLANFVYMTQPVRKKTIGILLADESYSSDTGPGLRDFSVINNVVLHNEIGIRFSDASSAGHSVMKNVTIANNTVVDNATTAIQWDTGQHDGSTIQNNIFASFQGRLLLQAGTSVGMSIDHNLWFSFGASAPFLWGSTPFDHTGWAAATGQGSGDIAADPLFSGAREPPVTNLVLLEGSPAIDSGIPLALVAGDLRGHRREGTPEIGAFEYGSAARRTPPPVGEGANGLHGSGGTPPDSDGGGANSGGAPAVRGDASGIGGVPPRRRLAWTGSSDGARIRAPYARAAPGPFLNGWKGGTRTQSRPVGGPLLRLRTAGGYRTNALRTRMRRCDDAAHLRFRRSAA
jgi:hypothetical protein